MISTSDRQRQSGAVIIMTAGFMLLAVLFLALVVDSGRLYLDKRSLQRLADSTALEVSSRRGCEPDADGQLPAFAFAVEHLTRNGFTVGGGQAVVVRCGSLVSAAGVNVPGDFVEGPGQVVFVELTRQVAASLVAGGIFNNEITLRAQAAATRGSSRLAALNMRSTIASISTNEDVTLLNAVVGGLLGGSLNLSLLAWDGLLKTNVSLLSFLNALAVDLGVSAGDYDQVLSTNASVGQILDATITALTQGGGTGSTANIDAAVAGLSLIRAAVPAGAPLIRLGDILQIQSGTDAAGLAVDTNVLGLVQGTVQLANGQSAVAVDLPINVPGVVGASVKVRVMEPPQLSAVGNPQKASMDPLGPDRIFVRSAQIRALVSVNLPVDGAVQSLLEGLLNNDVVSGITTAVNDVLSLNLLGLVNTLSCLIACTIERDVVDLRVLPTPRVDINIDSGGGRAFVTNFDCAGNKSLDVQVQTATASLRLGLLGSTAAQAASNVFSSVSEPTVSPVLLLDIGSKRVRYSCTLALFCDRLWRQGGNWIPDKALADRVAFAGGGIGISVNANPGNQTGLAGASRLEVYTDPPEGGLPNVNAVDPVTGQALSGWRTVSSSSVVGSLSGFLSAPELQLFRPMGAGLGSGLGNVVNLVGGVVNTLVSTLQGLINATLSPLLDPLLNRLLKSLGVDLNAVEVGANLTCESRDGARLLF